MKDRGWRIEVTGVHDDQSVAVARAFQHEKGLGLDGLVGDETWSGAFDLPVTPGPGRNSGVAPGGGHPKVTVSLSVNRNGDEIELSARVTNVGGVPIAENALTVLIRVVNPLASPDSSEYELARFEMPVLAIPVGQETFGMAYFNLPLRRDPFNASAWVYDSTMTYDSDDVSFQ
jgi:hypothetical protein